MTPSFFGARRTSGLERPVTVRPYPTRDSDRLSDTDHTVQSYARRMLGRVGPARKLRLRRLLRRVCRQENGIKAMSDTALSARVEAVRHRLIISGMCGAQMNEALALVREISGRTLGLRPHDEQVLAALTMLDGHLVEMATGEGKSLAAGITAAVAGLARVPTHLVTVNDYLAARDAEEMEPLFHWLGLTVGSIRHEDTPDARRGIYQRDIVYCSNKEITFDYLRDQVKIGQGTGDIQLRLRHMDGQDDNVPVMRGLHFAVVDEADSVLIDEARTPLILSQESDAASEQEWAQTSFNLANKMRLDLHYTRKDSEKRIELTDFGKTRLASFAEVLDPIWQNKIQREHAVTQTLCAKIYFAEGDQYVIQDGKVVIVDEYTGRLMPERSWNDGLHQLVEFKEGLELTGRKVAIARTTYQKFFRRYLRLSGMSGTAQEVQREISAVYRIATMRLPTRLPSKMRHLGTRVNRTENAKLRQIASRVQTLRDQGLPVLIGTRTVATSQKISARLSEEGIEHDVLNAVNADEEATVIADAGQPGRVTVATNMAGRGVHISVPDTVTQAGGLHVILTERHDSARIDRQLIGRTARQGQPGSYEAILALDDPLVTALNSPFLRRMAHLPGPVGKLFGLMCFRATQKRAERLNARARNQLLKMDRHLERVLAFSGLEE
ncbi:MAG: hypothetical protein AAGG57_17965 [Pseudomonadota bacterium]